MTTTAYTKVNHAEWWEGLAFLVVPVASGCSVFQAGFGSWLKLAVICENALNVLRFHPKDIEDDFGRTMYEHCLFVVEDTQVYR